MAAVTTEGSPVLCETNFLKRVWHVYNEKYKVYVYASRMVDGGVSMYSLGVWNSRRSITGEWKKKNKAETIKRPEYSTVFRLAA